MVDVPTSAAHGTESIVGSGIGTVGFGDSASVVASSVLGEDACPIVLFMYSCGSSVKVSWRRRS